MKALRLISFIYGISIMNVFVVIVYKHNPQDHVIYVGVGAMVLLIISFVIGCYEIDKVEKDD